MIREIFVPIRALFAKRIGISAQAAAAEGYMLRDLYAADGDKCRLLAAAAAMELGETHPLASALLCAAGQLALPLPAAEEQVHIRGRGITARIGEDVYFLGNSKGLRDLGIDIPHAVRRTDFSGYTMLYVVRNAEFFGFFVLQRALSSSVRTLVRRLNARGKICLLVGEGKDAEILAKGLGIKTVQKDLHAAQNRAKISMIDGEQAAMLCRLLAVTDRMIPPAQRTLSARLTLEETEMFGKVNYTMKIEGMNCTHCSARVKTALETLRGVSADISLEEKLARIKCPASLDAEKLTAAVTEVGFTVVSVDRV